MDILVCVKRVPATGGKITLTSDARAIDTRYASFTVSPHEECAVEEAIRLVEAKGGSTTVLTLGPPIAANRRGPAARCARDGNATGHPPAGGRSGMGSG